MKKTAIVLALALGLGAAGAASAASSVKVGSLSCKVSGGSSYVLGSSRDLTCTYHSVSGKKEKYTGKLDKVGVDVGVTDEAVLAWAVFAVGKPSKGALAGSYIGASADASLGVGGGAKVLIGGFDNSLTLQPISLQAQTGLNLAVGAAALKLASAK